MASKFPKTRPPLPLLLAVALILLLSPTANSDDTSNSDEDRDREECGESLMGLAACLAYVDGSAEAPTPDCCTGLKQVLKTKKKCLCVAIKDRNEPDLGIAINATLALGLPGACHAPVNVSQCPALLKLAPDSAEAQIFYQSSNGTYTTTPPPAIPNGEANPTTSRPFVQMSGGGSSNREGRPGLLFLTGLPLLLRTFRPFLNIIF